MNKFKKAGIIKPSKVRLNTLCYYKDQYARNVTVTTQPSTINVKVSPIIEVYVMNAVERNKNKNHTKPIGLRVVIRKKPHVTYVALKVYSQHK